MAIQRSAVTSWCGRTHPWEQRREEAPVRAEVPEASAQAPEVQLVDAVRAMVEALSDVVIQAPSDRPSPVFQTPNPPG